MILLVLVAVSRVRWPDPMPHVLVVAGVVIALAGLAFVIWARISLGGAFTMFPQPRQRDAPVSSGAYRFARHPIYGGLLLVMGGLALSRSLPSLVLVAALGVLWWRKSLEEERRLVAMFPDYPAYRQRVRRRFLPFVA